MTSKEIQQKIIGFENQIEQFGEMITLTNQLSILKSYKQDLERLEALEKENKELKETIEIRKQMNINLIDFSTKLKQENEKLKKAIKILKKYYKFKLFPPAMDNIPEISISTDWEHYISQQEYELLKEVLENE